MKGGERQNGAEDGREAARGQAGQAGRWKRQLSTGSSKEQQGQREQQGCRQIREGGRGAAGNTRFAVQPGGRATPDVPQHPLAEQGGTSNRALQRCAQGWSPQACLLAESGCQRVDAGPRRRALLLDALLGCRAGRGGGGGGGRELGSVGGTWQMLLQSARSTWCVWSNLCTSVLRRGHAPRSHALTLLLRAPQPFAPTCPSTIPRPLLHPTHPPSLLCTASQPL